MQARPDDSEPAGRWRLLAVLAAAVLLSFAPWFSASAVAPLLTDEWSLGGLDVPLLTIAVQFGFAGGALALAALGAADVIPARYLIAAGAGLAAVANIGFGLIARDAATAMPFRVLTGVALAAVYPVAMKVLAGWFRRERGVAIGVLIAALTVGSALPYLLRALGAYAGASAEWRPIVAAASAAAVVGGILGLAGVRPGPFEVPAPRFSVAIAKRAFGSASVRLANLGYLGHMWELYAMWTWVPAFLVASFAAGGLADPSAASLGAFLVVAAGGVGCVAAGLAADRLGRTAITIVAMACSGASAAAIGYLFGAPPVLTLAVAIFWGVTVVADSAQFSTAVSELAPPGTAGSALALQTATGFVLTGATILLVGALAPTDAAGWRVAFGLLALGPVVGIVAMWRLRARSDATLMAGGRR